MKVKAISLIVLFSVFITGAAFCQTTMTAQDEKKLEEFSKNLVRMKRSMDSFVKELVSAYSDQSTPLSVFGSDVRVDISENTKEFTVKADLPGMDKDKITVTLEGGRTLKISGSRQAIKQETGPNMVRQERMEGKFERVIELPAECKPDGIKASYKNGVLEIIIPKKEEAKPDMIKVDIQ